MALRAAEGDESRVEPRDTLFAAWAVEDGSVLDQLKPLGSLAWDRLESQ